MTRKQVVENQKLYQKTIRDKAAYQELIDDTMMHFIESDVDGDGLLTISEWKEFVIKTLVRAKRNGYHSAPALHQIHKYQDWVVAKFGDAISWEDILGPNESFDQNHTPNNNNNTARSFRNWS